ncbi:MAG: hypothetical protein ACTSXU_12205, partial [Promethearchaeota archaeon]
MASQVVKRINTKNADPAQKNDKRSFLPLYYLSFSGDFLLSLMIVASTLVGTRENAPGFVIGLLASAYGMSYMLAPSFLGFVSDKIGRRRS